MIITLLLEKFFETLAERVFPSLLDVNQNILIPIKFMHLRSDETMSDNK